MSNSQSRILHLPRIALGGFFTAAGLTFSAAAFAGIQDVESANNQFVAQFQYNYMHYAETANENETGSGGALDSEDGHITGYGLSGSVMKDVWLGRDYFEAQYSAFSGKTNYMGGTQTNPTFGSLVGESGAKIKEGSFRYGSGIVINNELMVTPFGELGRHQYVRTLVVGTPASYQETYTHNYFGIGALAQFSPSEKVVYSLNAMIGRTYGANLVAVLPGPSVGFSAKLGNSMIEKIGVSVDYAFTKNIHVNAGAEVAGWSYGASANQPIGNGLYVYEPKSTTSITTAKVGMGFSF